MEQTVTGDLLSAQPTLTASEGYAALKAWASKPGLLPSTGKTKYTICQDDENFEDLARTCQRYKVTDLECEVNEAWFYERINTVCTELFR